MGQVVVTPQHIEVAAPLDLVFALVSTVDYGYRPNARCTPQLVRREGERLVLRMPSSAQAHQPPTLKELSASPPGQIRYRHLSGPLAGAIEELDLRPTVGGRTQVTWSAEFSVEEGAGYLVRKMHLEHEASEHLLEIKAVAEQRASSSPKQGVALSWDASLPTLTSESALREAAAAQEEEEFGHPGHGDGVARVAMGVAQAARWSAGQVEQLRRAALLHDVGKIALDPTLWAFRGTLSAPQRHLMEAHVRFGYDLASQAGMAEEVATAILHHHERWDGQGYPRQLAGEGIPPAARLLFVAEVSDSMLRASYRRPPMAATQVAAVLEAGAGQQWDPHLARLAAYLVRGHA